MILDTGLYWSLVYALHFWNCVEGICVYHDITDSFTEVDDLNPYVTKERTSGPSPGDLYCFRI